MGWCEGKARVCSQCRSRHRAFAIATDNDGREDQDDRRAERHVALESCHANPQKAAAVICTGRRTG